MTYVRSPRSAASRSSRSTPTRSAERKPSAPESINSCTTRRGRFDVVLIWAFDRLARSVRHFLEVLDELNHLKIEFVSFRENIDTGGPLGRAIIIIIGAIAELERSLIVERVRAGMRRARIEGRHIGRPQLDLDRAAIVRHRAHGQSLGQLAKTFRVSRTTIARVLDEENVPVTKGLPMTPSQLEQNRPPETAA